MSRRLIVCRTNIGVANARKRKRYKQLQRRVNAARRLQGNDQKWRQQQRRQRPKWRWRSGERVSAVSLVAANLTAVMVTTLWRLWVRRRHAIGIKAVVTTWRGEFRMRGSTLILGFGWAASHQLRALCTCAFVGCAVCV